MIPFMVAGPALRSLAAALPYLAICAALGGAYWLGSSHASAECDKQQQEAAAKAAQESLTLAGIADAAAAQREQSRIIRQAALEGARKAIKEAAPDACIDTDAGDDVLRALGVPDASKAP